MTPRRMCLYCGQGVYNLPSGCFASFGQKHGVSKFLIQGPGVDNAGNGRCLATGEEDQWLNFIFDNSKDVHQVSGPILLPDHFHTLMAPNWLFDFSLPMLPYTEVEIACSLGESGCKLRLKKGPISQPYAMTR
jgi:hypothetical protein